MDDSAGGLQRDDATATNMLAAIIESSDDAILAKALDGTITSFNRGASLMYGYLPDEIIGQNMSLLIPPDHPDELESILERVARGERIEHYETQRLRKDGGIVEVSVTVSPIYGNDNTIVGISAIARDITSRKRLERARRESEERELAVLGSVPIFLFSADETGRLTSFRAGSALPDLIDTRDQYVGQTLVEMFAGSSVTESPLRRALEGENVTTAFEMLGHSFEMSMCPQIDSSGRQVGLTGVAVEITDQIRAFEEQRNLADRVAQYERLESLGQLAGGIAHDFNNLLGVIANCASFVVDEIEDHAAVLADIRQIEHAADRAAQLTRQLLAFARREVLQPLVIDLNRAILSVEDMLRRTLGEHVILVTDLADNLAPVLVDPGQFEQVFVNLAVNARDAMPLGGMLTVDTANVEIDEGYSAFRPGVVPGPFVRLRVSDNGRGIDESLLDRVFDPFFTTKAQGEGTGLGLATVFGIVSQAGGDVQIYSELGVGTTVRVLLPAARRAASIQGIHEVDRPLRGDETVLVVEDEEAMREVTRRILERNGYTAFVTGSGEEALQVMLENPGSIDLLLTDVVMPHMLGKEVAERLRELEPAVRVLYMSGHAHPVLGPILDAEASLVEKPFSEISLLAKVREVLDEGHSIRGGEI